MPSDYRTLFYERYLTAFKQHEKAIRDYAFSDAKLIPVLAPWVGHLPRTARCLDLGCGHGNILHALRTLGFAELEGVDLSGEQVEFARKMFPQVECMGLMEKLRASEPGRYQLITLFDVIEHLTKAEILELLQALVPRLAHNGVLVVHCPNGDSPFVGSVRDGDFTHETILTAQSARNLCRLFGLDKFAACEDLSASRSPKGLLRSLAWQFLRQGLRACHAVETGSAGSGIMTRNFAFKAEKCV
jgi:2-polyprenyl-3-methyl-5-hydroxy-6-metoxy-1,4-benzoquinol methylase